MISMTAKSGKIVTGRHGRRVTCVTVIMAWLIASSSIGLSEEFLAEFDGPQISWRVKLKPQESEVILQERRLGAGKSAGAEFIRIASKHGNTPIRLEHAVPAATVLDELEVSLWVKSTHEGFTLCTKIVLPEMLDPETNAPVSFRLEGEKYDTPNRWQRLTCKTTEGAVDDHLRQLRGLKKVTGTPKIRYVERVELKGHVPPGNTEIHLDNLALSPLVRHVFDDADSNSEIDQKVSSTAGSTDPSGTNAVQPILFELHRFYVEGKPFFPRIVTGQGERPEVFVAGGLNTVFLADYENPRVTGPLRRQGIWITAVPPFAKGVDGEPLDAEDTDLMPFKSETSAVAFWMLGTRMTPDQRPPVASWTNMVRNADRGFNKRPIAADVIESERKFSRHVDLLGISKHVIHSNCSLVEYREGIIQRRNQAWPDSFIWTWIQTEPAPTLVDLARKTATPPIVEPEQIRLQVYAALAAGCRGIGYWTTTPLDDDNPAARERLLALTQLNLELDLFEPWIASSSAPQLVKFVIDPSRAEQQAATKAAAEAAAKAAPPIGWRDPKKKTERPAQAPPKMLPREQRAALFRSEKGALLLPMWLDDTAQFVPGPLAAHNVSIIVPGGGETASVWEITTTGKLRNLTREQTLGGLKVKIPRFDQTAAILITTKPEIVEELNQKIATIQEQSATACVELAKLKLERTRQIHMALPSVAVPHPEDGPRLLGKAKLLLNESETCLRNKQFADAQQLANEALYHARLLQRSDWDVAVARLPNPTASPWALSFQSLPEHYRLLKQLESTGEPGSGGNLLPSGEFEVYDNLISERWRAEQSTTDVVDSSAELYATAKQGRYSLRLSTNPREGEALPKVISKPLVTMVSPGINVHTGQVVKLSGWIKIPKAITGGSDGVLVYDSLLGKPGAVRLKAVQDWKRFEILRPVVESQEMTVTLALQGLGEVFIDDLQVVALDPPSEFESPSSEMSPISPAKYSTLDSLRRLSPLPKRR